MAVEVRPIVAGEIEEFRRVPAYAFVMGTGENDFPFPIVPEWTTCGFVDGQLATSFEAYPFRVRLEGRAVAMAGITLVATLPQFRRRGLLRQVMTRALSDQRDQGQAVAILWASMGAIYQRFGFGMATTAVSYDVDVRQVAFVRGASPPGQVDLLPAADARPTITELYKVFCGPRTLLLHRADAMWEATLRGDASRSTSVAIYREAGEPRGYVVLQLGNDAVERGHGQVVNVLDWAALDEHAYRGLWEFMLAHDLAYRIRWQRAPEDDPAPFLFTEPRELGRRTGDGIFLRVNDVESALRQRPYRDSGSLTLEIVDDDVCPWNNGLYAIEVAGAEVQVRRAPTGEADLTMAPAALAVLYAGHRSASFLARAGLIRTRADAALATADRLFATTFAPWCPNVF